MFAKVCCYTEGVKNGFDIIYSLYNTKSMEKMSNYGKQIK